MMPSDFDSRPAADPYDWDTLARYVAGESTPTEAQAVRAWLAERPERARVVAALQQSIDGLAADATDVDVERALEQVHARMRAPEAAPSVVAPRPQLRLVGQPVPRARAIRWPVVGSLAAALVLAAIGVSTARRRNAVTSAQPSLAATYQTGVGERDTVRLRDGSSVVLGPSSRLDVGAGYGSTARTVALHGEGYFDVVHDPARPFTAHAGAATIVDVGTTFTVRDENGGVVRVAVTSGSVRLSSATRADSGVVLAAGDVATLGESTTPIVSRGAVGADETAFTHGRLVFRDAPLADVVVELRRWYGIELRVADSASARRRLTATFEGETPEQAMAIIGAALGVQVERRGDTVFVR